MSGSGGERKKRSSRGTGWEEAGAEFYQESYPGGDVDMEVLQRDPHHIATLLPSKQNRNATTKHPRRESRVSLKRRTSTRTRYNSTTARQSVTQLNDIQISMMPDLSENLSNEERMWEEIMLIKAMPISMSQKKEMKAKLQKLLTPLEARKLFYSWFKDLNISADTFRLQGLKQFKWRRRKMWEHFKIRWKETYMKLELWRHSLKEIEGNFGTGVVAFFLFVKWLMFLNLCVTLFVVLFIVVPTLFMAKGLAASCYMNDVNDTNIECCTEFYNTNISVMDASPFDFVQGSGWMETTYLFYGIYPHFILQTDLFYYNLPLAYISISLVCFLFSLAAILKSAAHGFKERLIEGEGQFYYYCNLVFGGWDFCIQNESSAAIKHKALYHEVKGSLEGERREEEKRNRSREERLKLLIIRAIVNCSVVLSLICAGSLIFFTYTYSRSELETIRDGEQVHYALLLEFAPSICIVALNQIVPTVFKQLATYEQYSPIFVVRVTLFRTVLLRLSSLGVLMASFYVTVKCQIQYDDDCNARIDNCEDPLCWEVYIGKQMYKLLILDTVSNIVITFLVNFPRMLIAKHINCKLTRLIGRQEFQLTSHVLDVVYTQTLSWLGSFYAPLLPAISTIVFLVIFHVKKFACLVNSHPSSTIYRASRSNSMFMSVLLVSFVVAVIPWAYSISEISPSKSCGPFKGQPSAWSIMERTFQTFPWWIKLVADFCTTAVFAIPVFVILVLSLYYYYAVANANKHMVDVLKKQLVLEGHDKQFLLNRLSAFIKQQQERHKVQVRSIEVPNS